MTELQTVSANKVLGTWRLQSYVREVLTTGQRFNQFGDNPDGYLGYAPDGRMYAIFTRGDRIAPRDTVPTDEEGVQLLGSMVAYAGTYTLSATENRVVAPHRHIVESGLDGHGSGEDVRARRRYAYDHDGALQELL